MVEHRIQNDTYAALMTGVHERLELFIGSKVRINFHVIACIVFVIRRGLEQRTEVNGIDAEPDLYDPDDQAHLGDRRRRSSPV